MRSRQGRPLPLICHVYGVGKPLYRTHALIFTSVVVWNISYNNFVNTPIYIETEIEKEKQRRRLKRWRRLENDTNGGIPLPGKEGCGVKEE